MNTSTNDVEWIVRTKCFQHHATPKGSLHAEIGDPFSRILRKRKQPWKVAEIEARDDWKKLEECNDDDFYDEFLKFLKNNEIYAYVFCTPIDEIRAYTNEEYFGGLIPHIFFSTVPLNEKFFNSKENVAKYNRMHKGTIHRDIDEEHCEKYRLFELTTNNAPQVFEFHKLSWERWELEAENERQIADNKNSRDNVLAVFIGGAILVGVVVGVVSLYNYIESSATESLKESYGGSYEACKQKVARDFVNETVGTKRNTDFIAEEANERLADCKRWFGK